MSCFNLERGGGGNNNHHQTNKNKKIQPFSIWNFYPYSVAYLFSFYLACLFKNALTNFCFDSKLARLARLPKACLLSCAAFLIV